MDSFDPTECLPENKILKTGDNHYAIRQIAMQKEVNFIIQYIFQS
jgi:hypothetical protein